jgi:Microcystin-dependent protein
MTEEVKEIIFNNSGVGEIGFFACKNVPYGWLLCDGSYKKKDIYPELHSVIGTIYGNYLDNNFKLPDCNNRFFKGSTIIGGLNESKLPVHEHIVEGTTHNNHKHPIYKGSTWADNQLDRLSMASNPRGYATYNLQTSGHSHNHLDDTGFIPMLPVGVTDTETVPKHYKLLVCIKY